MSVNKTGDLRMAGSGRQKYFSFRFEQGKSRIQIETVHGGKIINLL